MSSPSTPSRSSRASSAASSPAMRASKSPIKLTPRSKVKAMLAAAGMSDDSDDELATKPSNHTNPTNAPPKPDLAAEKPATDDASSDSEDEDAIPVRRPAGRIAARMLAAQNQDAQEKSSDEGAGNAYQRVRKMLMSSKDKRKEAAKKSSPELDAESSSGEDMPFRPAAARRTAQKPSETPKSTSPVSRQSSPGLFVSPSKPSPSKSTSSRAHGSGSDSDVPAFKPKSRLEELVAKKKAERKAREEAEKKERAEARKHAKAAAKKDRQIERELNGSETDSADDEGVAEKLTQQSRPTRRAGKKALEEMNRETQRMYRNMQLTHQAKTKKKYTTQDLFKRFNFGQPNGSIEEAPQNSSGVISSVAASSDVEHRQKETPPTSPPSMDDESAKKPQQEGMDLNGFPVDTVIDIGQGAASDAGLPNLKDVISHPTKIDKGKGRAVSPSIQAAPQPGPKKTAAPALASETKTRAFRVVLPERPVYNNSDSDDDLEIVRDTRFPVFDNLPARQAQEPKHLLALRHLAHLTSPSKSRQTGRNSMNPAELQLSLQRRAREQAKAEKEEKIAELRARGIIIQTEEEREKDALELDNLLEKARKEVEELAKKERSQAKKDGKAGEGDDLPDSDDDESYAEGDDEDVEDEEELELSGSEDEEEEEEGEDAGGLLDNMASEDDNEEMADEQHEDARANVEAPANADDAESEQEESTPARRPAAARNRKCVVDDEDEEEQEDKPIEKQSQQAPSQDDMMAAFGFANPAEPAGLSQMFAGTMAEMDSQAGNFAAADSQQDSLDFLRNIPISTIPEFESTVPDATQDSIIRDSLPPASQADKPNEEINIGISQFPSQPEYPATQMSDFPDPTQDGGFAISRTPGRFTKTPQPTSTQRTVDTVILPDDVPESPVVQRRKGRLQRRTRVAETAELSDIDGNVSDQAADAGSEGEQSEDQEFEISANAFDAMRKGAKKAKRVELFDKKKSAAKEMVQEQAEESEDEYAGLGGASDDESGGEMDEELKQMIDESNIKVDERQLAAFYANKQRDEDEKNVNKLYKDITTGALRRKRGGDFELSDSDDDGAERRRRKQREFARMRKALLEDEKIGKIAENPKKLAFLRAIEDHDDEEDFDFLGPTGPEESQSQSIPDSQEPQPDNAADTSAQPNAAPAAANPLKRKAPVSESNDENRPPARQRRTPAAPTTRKPTTLAEIRENLSFLVDEPLVRETQLSASEESADEEQAPRSRQLSRSSSGVVDRLSRSNSGSIVAEGAAAAGGRPLAFAAAGGAKGHGFRVPALLRRATTGLSATSTTSSSSSGSAAQAQAAGVEVRRGGSKKSNIHYQAREAERKKVIVAAEQRREEGLRRKVVKGRGRSVLGVLGGGGFE